MRLSGADFSFIREMRKEGVFDTVIPAALKRESGKVVCQCGDGHRFRDWFGHLSQELCFDDELIHPVTVNGGALTLGPKSPLAHRYGRPHDLMCLDNIREGCEIKQTKTVILGVHFPCGMAYTAKLGAPMVLEHFIAAKERLRKEIPGVSPIMLVHVDYEGHRSNNDEERRFCTYFFNRKRYEALGEKFFSALRA